MLPESYILIEAVYGLIIELPVKLIILDIEPVNGDSILEPVVIVDNKTFIKPSEFCGLLRKKSLEVKSIKGISYNIFNKKFYESNNPNINYIIHCKKNND